MTSAPDASACEPLRPERHRLIEPHVAADDRRLADDDAGAVINEEPLADLSAGMDVDAGRRMRVLGDDARDHRDAEIVEFMREAMADDRGEAGKAEDDLVDALGRRIALEGGPEVGVEQGAHLRQGGGEGLDDVAGPERRVDPALALPFPGQREFELDLAPERGKGRFEGAKDEGVDVVRGEIRRAEMPRIERGDDALRRSR